MDSSYKQGAPDRPLVPAFLAFVTAWTASLAIISHGLFYLLDADLTVSGRVKLPMVVPMALTAVSFEAVRLRRSSVVVWISAALQVLFSAAFLLYFLFNFNLGLLHFAAALFLFWAASRMSIEEGLVPERIVPIKPTAWTRLNGFARRREEPRE